MKLILAQPAIPYLQWQLEVLLVNLKQFGVFDVVLLFTERDFTVPGYFEAKYPECEIHVYKERKEQDYVPSVRPYLWWKYLSEDATREQETYFYIDADVIFREWIDFATLGFGPDRWVASHCDGYISYDEYLHKVQKGDEIIAKMAEICGITLEQAKAAPPAGAQWVITNPTADYWKRVYDDSNAIYSYFEHLDSDIQKWTAEMWAQLYGTIRAGKQVRVSPELDFIMPTDPVEMWDKVKILHNAGVHGTNSIGMFYKGAYIDNPPFHADLSGVRTDRATIKYVAAVKKVVSLS